MAKLPIEITVLVNQLKQQALDIVDESLAVELKIFEQFGETEQTIAALDEMKNAGEDAASAYSQLSTVQLQIAKIQPDAPSDVLQLLTKAIERTQNSSITKKYSRSPTRISGIICYEKSTSDS